MKNEFILLIRSFNRPQYLKQTINSLLEAELSIFTRKIIYDDCSTNEELLEFYKEDFVKSNFEIVLSSKNFGCKKSLLFILKKLVPKFDYFCLLDDDVLVKKDFGLKLYKEYQKIIYFLKTDKILLTGFRPTNAHKNEIKIYDTFCTKRNCGAINYFFNHEMKDIILKGWEKDLDHGVAKLIRKEENAYLCCLLKGVIQHIGFEGLHSKGKKYDFDKNF